ncbi:MAG: hypothetical protein A2V79_09170 [Betaproteobacteria bacterium RBG_16_56_24]|nr:MAG: hypothetical protein A2V79_09170 [Betaproteobacteria bacterium RBG_16_56_24]
MSRLLICLCFQVVKELVFTHPFGSKTRRRTASHVSCYRSGQAGRYASTKTGSYTNTRKTEAWPQPLNIGCIDTGYGRFTFRHFGCTPCCQISGVLYQPF